MKQTSILEELRHIREQLLVDAGGTLAGLAEQLQQDECTSGRKVLAPADLPRNRRTMEHSVAAADPAIFDGSTMPAH